MRPQVSANLFPQQSNPSPDESETPDMITPDQDIADAAEVNRGGQ
jgi:hypothetical protein